MHSYIETALINAAMVVPLALLAEATGRALRRPALTHLLWVLILVKLVTPPIWYVPLIDRDWLASAAHRVVRPVFSDREATEVGPRLSRSVNDSAATPKPKSRQRPRTLAEQDKRIVVPRATPMMAAARWIRSADFRELMITSLMLIWGLGALVWFGLQSVRCVRFRLSLAKGTEAGPELQQFSDELAQRLGLTSSPTVWLMPGVMSPMLWGSGQSTLLIFPELLLDRLDRDAAGTLLTHELAHYRRRDHFVRIVALVATGFFWWHPVVWWARRSIEAVEEECCDALVLKAAAAPPKRYAEAILDTVDFLAEFRLKLPPLATGLGQLPFLRQRLTWIMRGPRKQELGYFGRILFLIAASNLPWQPTWLEARSPAPLIIPSVPVPQLPAESTQPSRSGSYESDIAVPVEVTSVSPNVQPEAVRVPSRWAGFSVRSQSFDGRFVVLGNKAALFLLDLESGHEFELSDFSVTAMSFSPNSYQFVTIGVDRCLRLWDAETTEVTRGWQVPGGPSKSVDLSSDARWIVTGGRDGIIRVWDQDNSQPLYELPRELAPVNCLRFSLDGKLLAVATGDWMSPQSGRIALYDVGRWIERISMNWNSPAAVVAFRADGESLTSGDWQGRIARWSLETGELLGLTEGHKDLVASAEFSPNGSLLAEINIPDFQPDATWGEPEPSGQVPWFFDRWTIKSPASPTMPRMNGNSTP